MPKMTRKSIFNLFREPPLFNTPTPNAVTTTGTLTTDEIFGEVLYVDQGSGGTTTQTTPTGTEISAAIPGRINIGDSFDLWVINREKDSGGNLVLATGTDVTLIGNNDVEEENVNTNSSSAHFRFRNTGANTWDLMRLS